jgi:peptidoglycan/xylan/chitin deacetylase (PgdA/CDA1 family)
VKLPILTYHAVLPLEAGHSLRGTVTLDSFRTQIEWLARRGFTALDLGSAADLLADEGACARRPIALTFDDGYRCVVEHALPVLESFGFSATLFVVTDAVGRSSDWYLRKGGRAFEHATWDELERAKARGFAVESHGVAHRRLTEIPSAEADEEIGRSRELIARRLGRCDHFAYPFGAFSDATAGAVLRCGYRTACTTRGGFNRRAAPLAALRRQNIGRNTRMRGFRRRAGSWW